MILILASDSLDILNVNPGLVIWTFVTFLLVVFVLKKFAWDVIISALDARALTIQKNIEDASQLKEQSEKVLLEYQDKLIKARDEATEIVAGAKFDAMYLRDKMLEDAKKEIQALKDQTNHDIELAKSKASHDLHSKIVNLSILIASKILEKQLVESDYSKFIEVELSKLNSAKL